MHCLPKLASICEQWLHHQQPNVSFVAKIWHQTMSLYMYHCTPSKGHSLQQNIRGSADRADVWVTLASRDRLTAAANKSTTRWTCSEIRCFSKIKQSLKFSVYVRNWDNSQSLDSLSSTKAKWTMTNQTQLTVSLTPIELVPPTTKTRIQNLIQLSLSTDHQQNNVKSPSPLKGKVTCLTMTKSTKL